MQKGFADVSEALMPVVNINAVILQAKIVRTFADLPFSVIPAKAGIHIFSTSDWILADAGMTKSEKTNYKITVVQRGTHLKKLKAKNGLRTTAVGLYNSGVTSTPHPSPICGQGAGRSDYRIN